MPTNMIRWAVLRDPAIRLFLVGNFLSNIGTWIQRIAIGWLVFNLTQSAGWVGAIAMCEVLPALVVTPLAGVLVDSVDRVKVFAAGQVAAVVQAALLTVLAAMDLLGLPGLVAAALLLGVIDGVNQPTRMTLVSDVASPVQVPATVVLSSLTFNAARFIGPAAAGVILTAGGPSLAFGANALSFLPLLVFLTRFKRRNPGAGITMEPPRDGLRGGIRHAANHVILAPVFLMLIGSSLFGRSVIDLLPAIAGLWFGSAPEVLASLTASVGVGAMAGALWQMRRGSLTAMLAAALTLPGGLSLLVLLFGASGGYAWVAYPILVLVGFTAIGYGVGMQTVMQLTVHPHYRGRVASIYAVIQRGLPAVGAFLLGIATDRFGLRPTLIVGGCIGLLIWFLIWRRRARIQAALLSHLHSASR